MFLTQHFSEYFPHSEWVFSRKFSHFKYTNSIQGAETATRGLFNQIKLLEIPVEIPPRLLKKAWFIFLNFVNFFDLISLKPQIKIIFFISN